MLVMLLLKSGPKPDVGRSLKELNLSHNKMSKLPEEYGPQAQDERRTDQSLVVTGGLGPRSQAEDVEEALSVL